MVSDVFKLAKTYAQCRADKDWVLVDKLKSVAIEHGSSIVHLNEDPVMFKIRVDGNTQLFFDANGDVTTTDDIALINAGVTGRSP